MYAKNHTIKILIVALAMVLLIFAYPAAMYATEAEEPAFQINDTLYVTTMTYFYAQPGPGDYYGKLKAGSKVKVEEITDGYLKTTYADQEGYLLTSDLAYEVPTHTVIQDDEVVETAYFSYPDMIYPASHFCTDLDVDANFLLIQFSTDEEDDNYVSITNGNEAILYGLTISCLYDNGCKDVEVRVMDDTQENVLFIMKIPTWEASEDEYMDLSFTFTDGRLSFAGGDFGHDIYIGFLLKDTERILLSGSVVDTKTEEDGYAWIVATGQKEILIADTTPEVKDTSDLPENEEAESKEETPPLQKVLIGIAVGAAVILDAVFIWNQRKKKMEEEKYRM